MDKWTSPVNSLRCLYQDLDKRVYTHTVDHVSLIGLEDALPFSINYGVMQSSQLPHDFPEPSRSKVDALSVQSWSLARLNAECQTPTEIAYGIREGAWLFFLVEDRILDPQYEEILMVHEVAELLSHGDHRYAEQKEFEEAARRGDDFLDGFTRQWGQLYTKLSKLGRQAVQINLPARSIEILREMGEL